MQLLDVIPGRLDGAVSTPMQSISQRQQQSRSSTSVRHRPVRLVCLGRLTTSSGAVEFLAGLAAWADHHVDALLDVTWTGAGVLQTVLRAQPSRPNIQQHFLATPSQEDLHGLLGRCQLAFATELNEAISPRMAAAIRQGLVVLCSDPSAVRRRATDSRSIVLYNPLRPHQLAVALNRSLALILLPAERDETGSGRADVVA